MIKRNLIKSTTFTFIIGGIPLPITIKSDLLGSANISAKGEIKATAGFCAKTSTKIGINYINDVINPISSNSTTFNIYKPQISSKANFNIEAAFYPKINILFLIL